MLKKLGFFCKGNLDFVKMQWLTTNTQYTILGVCI